MLYTHYQLLFPNGDCRPKMSGNYRVHITDEDDGGREVIAVETADSGGHFQRSGAADAVTGTDLQTETVRESTGQGSGRTRKSQYD